MTADLTRSQWLAIEKVAVYLAPQGERTGRYIAMDKLREIIRKPRRSTDQNALLWALYDDVLTQGGETLGGWTRDDLHTYLLGEHFGWARYDAFGMTRQKPMRRSSRLTKSEFSDYIAFVVQRMAEHGIVLSLPGDQAAA